MPNDPNPEWGGVVAIAVTRTQVQKRGNPKALKVMKVMSKMAVDRDELVRLQEDFMLQKYKEAKGTETRKGYGIAYQKLWRNLVPDTSVKG